MVLVAVDGWCCNKKDIGETGGVWWMDKEEAFVSNVDIDDRNICVDMKIIMVLKKWEREWNLCFC